MRNLPDSVQHPLWKRPAFLGACSSAILLALLFTLMGLSPIATTAHAAMSRVLPPSPPPNQEPNCVQSHSCAGKVVAACINDQDPSIPISTTFYFVVPNGDLQLYASRACPGYIYAANRAFSASDNKLLTIGYMSLNGSKGRGTTVNIPAHKSICSALLYSTGQRVFAKLDSTLTIESTDPV